MGQVFCVCILKGGYIYMGQVFCVCVLKGGVSNSFDLD